MAAVTWGTALSHIDSFVLASPDIASEEFDGEYVILDLGSGRYFSLSGLAAAVWRGLVDGHSVSTLGAGLAAGDERIGLVAQAAEAMVGHGLLRRGGQPPNGPVPDAILAALAEAEPVLRIEVFDDLADLLVADPIHDVDETAGWPHRPAAAGTVE